MLCFPRQVTNQSLGLGIRLVQRSLIHQQTLFQLKYNLFGITGLPRQWLHNLAGKSDRLVFTSCKKGFLWYCVRLCCDCIGNGCMNEYGTSTCGHVIKFTPGQNQQRCLTAWYQDTWYRYSYTIFGDFVKKKAGYINIANFSQRRQSPNRLKIKEKTIFSTIYGPHSDHLTPFECFVIILEFKKHYTSKVENGKAKCL